MKIKTKYNKHNVSAYQQTQLKIKRQQGFSLLEIFVALAIGLVIFAGVLSVFVGMKSTVSETSHYGELQENGRFAISVLSDDLLRQNFWGDYTGSITLANINPVPAAPVGECVGGGVNNGTFPLATGSFRTLWADTVTNASILSGCVTDAKKKSDVLQIKRVVSTPEALVAGAAAPAGNYYFMSNMDNGTLFAAGTVPDVKNGRVWEYQHHIYYVRDEAVGSDTVPVLMQGRLASNLSFAPIIDGIEMVRFEFGIDMDTDPTAAGYGIVDAYVPTGSMTNALWDNQLSRIISVKIYVLARSIKKDIKYKNKNTYSLGGFNYTVDDNYRRLLFSSTVTLYNASIDMWN